MKNSNKRFDVALSYPGERRLFVHQVAEILAGRFGHKRVLFQKYHEAEFARPNLDIYLPGLYRTESELIAIFLCAEYQRKWWCQLEWRHIRQLIATVHESRIMFLSFDEIGEVPELGILPGDGYVAIGERPAEDIAALIIERFAQEHDSKAEPKASSADPHRRWLIIPDREWNGTPGALLRADIAVVKFHGRKKEMEYWKRWAKNGNEAQVAVITGSCGMGKTRLAREICQELRSESILCGFLDPFELHRCLEYLETRTDGPMLLVVDYAETLDQKIATILRIVAKRKLKNTKVMLLARNAGFWLTRLKRMGDGVGDLITRDADKLEPLTLDIEARKESYHLANEAFAEKLERPKAEVEPGDWEDPDFKRALLLHMAALLAVQNVEARGMNSILEKVLLRESDYWSKQLRSRGLPQIIELGFERTMGIISGYGGVRDRREAVEIISRIGFFHGQPRATIEAVAEILHDCYPGDSWIEPIQPDLLKEYLVEKATREYPEDFLEIVM